MNTAQFQQDNSAPEPAETEERLRIFNRVADPLQAERPRTTLTLPFELRSRSRLLTRLDDGREVGVFLERGTVLRHGDCLLASDGSVIRVVAAREPVSTGRAANPLHLARACYHLGNRHMPLQVGDGWLRYQADHVLDDMVRGLGLEVVYEEAPFEPEAGAYGGGHSHGHAHDDAPAQHHGHAHGD